MILIKTLGGNILEHGIKKALTDGCSKLRIDFKDIFLRDYIISDIEDDIRWMTTEIEWHDWDAPWEKEDLKKFNADEFREKKMKGLKGISDGEILRTKFEICTQEGIHIGGCNSYLINDEYEWIHKTGDSDGYRTIGISICESKYWNKGFGTQILLAFIKYFLDYGINEIYTQTWSGNYRMVNLAEKIGFVECQRERGSQIIGDNSYDGLTFRLDIERYNKFYKLYINQMQGKS